MTEKDKEIQELRAKVKRLEWELSKVKRDLKNFEAIHALDLSEIIWLRRALERENEGRNR